MKYSINIIIICFVQYTRAYMVVHWFVPYQSQKVEGSSHQNDVYLGFPISLMNAKLQKYPRLLLQSLSTANPNMHPHYLFAIPTIFQLVLSRFLPMYFILYDLTMVWTLECKN